MIHKMGLTKCPYPYLKHFDVVTPEQKIILHEGKGNTLQIASILMGSDVMRIEVNDEVEDQPHEGIEINHMVSVGYTLKLSYKVFYGIEQQSQLSVKEQSVIYIGHIKMPYYIDGTSIRQLHYQNKLQVEVFIEDVTVNCLREGVALINPYLIVNLNYTKSQSVAVIMGDDFNQDNVYLAKREGKKLIQRTFDTKVQHINLKWGMFSQSLTYMKVGQETLLYRIYVGSKEVVVFELAPEIEAIEDYVYVGQEQLVIGGRQRGVVSLYEYDLTTKELSILTHALEGERHTQLRYSAATGELFFVKTTEAQYILCKIKLKTYQIEEVAFFNQKFTYFPTFEGEYVVIREDSGMMHLLKTDQSYREQLILHEQEAQIKWMDCSPRANQIGLLIHQEQGDQVALYDIGSGLLKVIKQPRPHVTIGDCTFDDLGESLYISSNDLGKFDMYTLDLTTKVQSMHQRCDAQYIRILPKWL